MKLVVKCIKTKNGNLAPVLCLRLDYRDAFLSFDKALISEATGLDVRSINTLEEGKEIIIIGG